MFAIIAALLPLQASPEISEGFAIELPEGPVREAWARVGPDQAPHAELIAWPDPDDPAWATDAPWTAWVGALDAAREGGLEARASLAVLAASQGRDLAAWEHLGHCAERPDLIAATLPKVLLGLPAAAVMEPGGAPAPLPDGIVLRPRVPPPTPGLGPNRIDLRDVSIRGLRVGTATLSITVQAAGDGVQVDVLHLSGEAATVRVVIPPLPGLVTRKEYLDWEGQPTIGVPLSVTLLPNSEEHSFWARAMPAPEDWPGSVPAAPLAALPHGGIEIELLADDPEAESIAALARALGRLFEVPSSIRLASEARVPGPVLPVVLRLHEGPGRNRKRAAILTLAERYALR